MQADARMPWQYSSARTTLSEVTLLLWTAGKAEATLTVVPASPAIIHNVQGLVPALGHSCSTKCTSACNSEHRKVARAAAHAQANKERLSAASDSAAPLPETLTHCFWLVDGRSAALVPLLALEGVCGLLLHSWCLGRSPDLGALVAPSVHLGSGAPAGAIALEQGCGLTLALAVFLASPAEQLPMLAGCCGRGSCWGLRIRPGRAVGGCPGCCVMHAELQGRAWPSVGQRGRGLW